MLSSGVFPLQYILAGIDILPARRIRFVRGFQTSRLGFPGSSSRLTLRSHLTNAEVVLIRRR